MGKTSLPLIFMYMCSQLCCLWSLRIFFKRLHLQLLLWIHTSTYAKLNVFEEVPLSYLPYFLHNIAPLWYGRAQGGDVDNPEVRLKLLLMPLGGLRNWNCCEELVWNLSTGKALSKLCIQSGERVSFWYDSGGNLNQISLKKMLCEIVTVSLKDHRLCHSPSMMFSHFHSQMCYLSDFACSKYSLLTKYVNRRYVL